jgi:hypothetical protein
MSHHSGRALPFERNRHFLIVPCRLQAGDGLPFGGRACMLIPDSEKPMECWATLLCLP